MKTITILLTLLAAIAAHAETIGAVETSGLFLKDTVSVQAFDDPTIEGVTCYTTVHKRALPWSEGSSSVSLACRKTGEIKGALEAQSNVFSRSKNIFFKTTVVDRFYDERRGVLVYLTYTKSTSAKNKSHSISVVVVRDE